jgi:hypothetical protein
VHVFVISLFDAAGDTQSTRCALTHFLYHETEEEEEIIDRMVD